MADDFPTFLPPYFMTVFHCSHLGSSLSVRSLARFVHVSVCDFLALGSSVSVRAIAKLGSSVSVLGKVRKE